MNNIEKIRQAVINAHDVEGNPREGGKSPYRVYQLLHEDSTIRLADVLLAIVDNSHWMDTWLVTTTGKFYKLDEVGSGDKGNKIIGNERLWNLRKDSLTDQSEETLQFIANLL